MTVKQGDSNQVIVANKKIHITLIELSLIQSQMEQPRIGMRSDMSKVKYYFFAKL